jgi:hypothetical protein
MTGVDNFFSSGTVLRERSGSVGNEKVAESEEMSVVPKPTTSLHIYGRPYN